MSIEPLTGANYPQW
jgi:hypothetical protein